MNFFPQNLPKHMEKKMFIKIFWSISLTESALFAIEKLLTMNASQRTTLPDLQSMDMFKHISWEGQHLTTAPFVLFFPIESSEALKHMEKNYSSNISV